MEALSLASISSQGKLFHAAVNVGRRKLYIFKNIRTGNWSCYQNCHFDDSANDLVYDNIPDLTCDERDALAGFCAANPFVL